MKNVCLISVLVLLSCFVFGQYHAPLFLSSQAEIDAFDQEVVNESLYITGEDIVDLGPLDSIKIIRKALVIENCPNLEEINSFNNITSLGYNLDFSYIPSWVNIDIDTIETPLRIRNNSSLKSVKGFKTLRSLGKSNSVTMYYLNYNESTDFARKWVAIDDNPSLEVVHFPSFEKCWKLSITNNISLDSLIFDSLVHATTLTTWGGTSNSGNYKGEIIIKDNPNLSYIKGCFISRIFDLSEYSGTTDSLTIKINSGTVIIEDCRNISNVQIDSLSDNHNRIKTISCPNLKSVTIDKYSIPVLIEASDCCLLEEVIGVSDEDLNLEKEYSQPEIVQQPQGLTVQCDQTFDFTENINQWLENNLGIQVESECTEPTISNDWDESYQSGEHPITFTISDSLSGYEYSSDVMLTILPNQDPPLITQGPQTLDIIETDPGLESKIQDWLDVNAYTEAIQNCGTYEISHDYDYDYSVGNHFVTFSVEGDNGMVTDTIGTIGIQLCKGEWTTEAQDLVVQCDQDGNYTNQVDQWLAENGGLVITSDCEDAISYTHDWNGSYDIGNYWITFKASGQNSSLENIRGAFMTIQRGESAAVITTQSSDLTLVEDDLNLETSIQAWLDLQGGAEAFDNCGGFEWSHDFDFNYSAGNHWVRFTATSDNEQSVESVALLSIQAISSTSDLSRAQISIFPNPTANQITVSHLTPGSTVTILAIDGNQLLTQKVESETWLYEMLSYPQGVYTLIVTDKNDDRVIRRFVKL